MLPSPQRLSRIEITTLRADPQAHVVFNRVGTFRFYKKNIETKGFSVILSKKHQKKAVKRNTLRRRIYAIVSKNPYFLGFRGVLALSGQSYGYSYKELESSITELLQKTQ